MVEVVNDVSLRDRLARERLEKLDKLRPRGGIRVVPTEEKYRALKHPDGTTFPAEGSAEWPNDRFTNRRIAEGAIKLADEAAKPDEAAHQPRRKEQEK